MLWNSRQRQQKLATGLLLWCLVFEKFALGQEKDLNVDQANARTGFTVKKELESTESPLLADLDLFDGKAPLLSDPQAENNGPDEIESLLPRGESLFEKDAVDEGALNQMDCHLRNIDYCFAGVMGSASKALPESDSELEVRCDEMRAASSCAAIYNKRCQTFKVFAMLAPFADSQQAPPLPPQVAELRDLELPPQAEGALMGGPLVGGAQATERIRTADLAAICEPSAKGSRANRALRLRLFKVARCVNQRIPALRPCLEDLKAALQLFFEPTRSLPLRPTCCALARFRECSIGALDGVCGLNSLDQLEATLTSGSGAMLKTVERMCRQASSARSAYCLELLPPSGMKVPVRRGSKASKLAKALDLFSFAPAAQT